MCDNRTTHVSSHHFAKIQKFTISNYYFMSFVEKLLLEIVIFKT